MRFTGEEHSGTIASMAGKVSVDVAIYHELTQKIMEQARQLQLRGEADTAATLLIQQGIAVAPEWPTPYLALVELLIGERRFEDALQVMPEMPPASDQAVKSEIETICHAGLGNDEAAIQAACQVRERPRVMVALGTLAARRGDLAGAEASFRRAIAADPCCASGWLSLGMLLWGQGKQEEAWQALKRSVTVDPLNKEAVRILRDMAERLDHSKKQG